MTRPILSRFPMIEPLEARIAPALLVNGANLLGGSGDAKTGKTSIGGNEVTLVKVVSGKAVVWFQDGLITGISFGPNARLEITGNVYGDLIGNLTDEGRLSDSDENPLNGNDGNKLLANNLLSLKTFPLSGEEGDITSISAFGSNLPGDDIPGGSIITGGTVSNVTINGRISGIYAGDGVFRAESSRLAGGAVVSQVGVDINPVAPGVQTDFSFTDTADTLKSVAGASIKNVTIGAAKQAQIFAGNGDTDGADSTGTGAAGGSITKLNILSAFINGEDSGATPSYFLHAGDGENGAKGGAGGSISNLTEQKSRGIVVMTAGNGGNGAKASGGAGGAISKLDVQSDSSNYRLTGGNGGNGANGGAGGAVKNNDFTNRTPGTSLVIAGDFTGDHSDDVLVIDSSTGLMVLSRSVGGGADFPKVIQSFDPVTDEPIVTIKALGITPVDAIPVDFDRDGDLDVIVAYKNSASLGFYSNDGFGNFYNPVTKAASGFTVGLGFSPALISLDSPDNASSLAVIENLADSSAVHRVVRSFGDIESYAVLNLATPLARPATDIVSAGGGRGLFVGTLDGSITHLTPISAGSDSIPYLATATGQSVVGGVLNLDVDSTGNQLLALGGSANTLSLFQIGGGGILGALSGPDLSNSSNDRALLAQFVDNPSPTADSIAILYKLNAGSRLDLYKPQAADANPDTLDGAYALESSLNAAPSLKNFAFAFSDQVAKPGIAAVGGSLSQFYFSRGLSAVDEYSLPFTGKRIVIDSGDGGDVLDGPAKLGKGGAGGDISRLNAEAIDIQLHTGHGGDSINGAAGAGGSVTNPAIIRAQDGTSTSPKLIADKTLEITTGSGGAATGEGGKSASGGHAGSISGVKLSLATGEIKLTTGDGGNGRGSRAGNAGDIHNVQMVSLDANVTVITGHGGDAPLGANKAGNGGSISSLGYKLNLGEAAEALENSYFVHLRSGAGGQAIAGTGGQGGSLDKMSLLLDGADRTYDDPEPTPPLVDAHRDSTVSVSVEAGSGGSGASGGAGGSVSKFSSVSVFDQRLEDGSVYLNYVVFEMSAGAGGAGTVANGGNGGSLGFAREGVAGVTFYDPDTITLPADNPGAIPLRLSAGDGGAGALKGGQGGSISKLSAGNSPFVDGSPISYTHLSGALLFSGAGGASGKLAGGNGGDLSGIVIATQNGSLVAVSGDGGAGGSEGRGGNGGAITRSNFGVVNVGLELSSGSGGSGTRGGGNGGLVSALQISAPQLSSGISAVIFSGNGGDATGSGAKGGNGGEVTGIFETKDLNSAINHIGAGNGGNSVAGAGGNGGNLSSIHTVGYIGKPSFDNGFESARLGVFDEIDLAQGLFSGRGGTGTTTGLAGAVSNVTAQQIAAIAAAVDVNGLFGVARAVTGITAKQIGFDRGDGSVPDGVFTSSNPDAVNPSPSTTAPVDGFILASVITNVKGVVLRSFNS